MAADRHGARQGERVVRVVVTVVVSGGSAAAAHPPKHPIPNTNRRWAGRDSNPRPWGYEPRALTG